MANRTDTQQTGDDAWLGDEDELRETTELRERALKRLKKRRDFYTHLIVYAVVNGFLVVIWAITSHGGFFWPVFPLAAWGVGVVLNAWDLFSREEFSEAAVSREMHRIARWR